MTLPFGQLSFPEIYERELVGPLFRPFAEVLVEAVAPAPGERALDLACGTGIVARLCRTRPNAGPVVGIDASPGMLAVARSVAPEIDWREGDASSPPLREGEQFDVVLCHQGLQFFPDRAAAVRHVRRALSVSGRVGVATWTPETDNPFIRDLRAVAERRVGPIVDRRHSFGETAALETLLNDGGLRDINAAVIRRTVRFSDGSVFVRLNATALVGMSAAAEKLGEEDRRQVTAAIVQESQRVLAAYSDAGGLAFTLGTTIATARRGSAN